MAIHNLKLMGEVACPPATLSPGEVCPPANSSLSPGEVYYSGDGSADGDVSSADYSIWLDTLGSTSDLRADGNDDGVVDQDDYDVWFSHFGNTLTLTNVLVNV